MSWGWVLPTGSCTGSCRPQIAAGAANRLASLLSADDATLLWLARVEQQLCVVVFTAVAQGRPGTEEKNWSGTVLAQQCREAIAASMQPWTVAADANAARAAHQQHNSTAVAAGGDPFSQAQLTSA